MSDGSHRESFWRLTNPVVWGIALSSIVLGTVCLLAIQVDGQGVPAYERFFSAEPNAMGDTLAGVFASLAFIWIVVTVFLQSAELREQREVLKAQRDEFEQMVLAQQAQVDALRAQAEIFLDEQKDRREKRAENLFSAQFESVKNQMLDIAEAGSLWTFERDRRLSGYGIGDHQYRSRLRELQGRDLIESILRELKRAEETLRIIDGKKELRFFPGRKMLEALEERVIDLQQIDGLSEATRIVLRDHRLERILVVLTELFSISSGLPGQQE